MSANPTAPQPAQRPVRLTLGDDLVRSRGTVFFRVLLALPFLIWMVVWGVGAACVALVNWFATLVKGQSPRPLHDFLVRFVRYSTQTYAYLSLAVEPLPAFDAKSGYPIDVEIAPPARQNRWGVVFRAGLALPALLLLGILTGYGGIGYSPIRIGSQFGTNTAIGAAALLGWFFALARRRMPRGLRDLIAYALSYGAQFWSYLLLLTDRYPSSDPLTAIGPLPTRSDPVRLEVDDDLRRSRLTVLFRLPLAFPHLIWLSMWTVVALLTAVVNWVATLIAGVSPQRLHRFLAAYVRYYLQVYAFLCLVGNPFPGFVGGEGRYPIDLRVAGRQSQNRWTVLFRIVLAVPALVLAGVFGSLLSAVAVLGWVASLVTGRMPLGLRNSGALSLRFLAQMSSYLLLVAGAYPYSGPCLERPPAPVLEAAPPAPAVPPPA